MNAEHVNIKLVTDVIAALPDPEIPVVTLADLGILRRVESDETGHWTITITPTYSGCPAMKTIEQTILEKMSELDLPASVQLELEPAWTTDWISIEGRKKLKSFGIAPPPPTVDGEQTINNSRLSVPLFVERNVNCPRCDSPNTQQISAFGATACKEPWQCLSCSEPFEHFKCH